MENRDEWRGGPLEHDPRLSSRIIRQMHDMDLSRAAQIDTCVLLTGRPEVVEALAREIHSRSRWRSEPFIVIDCDRPEAELESRLFGDVSAEDAEGGTVLLREVGHLSFSLQRRLAERLAALRGEEAPRRRRLMASTSEPLLPRVLDGTFDDQLFYRLNAIHVIPPGENGAPFHGHH